MKKICVCILVNPKWNVASVRVVNHLRVDIELIF